MDQPNTNPSSPARRPTGRWDPLSLLILGVFGLVVLTLLVAMMPNYITFHNTSQAERLIAQENYAAAIPHLQKIVAKHPGAWARQGQLGDCYLETGKPREAISAYQAALKDNPELDLDEKMGIALLESGDKQQAMTYLSKVLAKKPDSPAANYYLGIQQFEAGDNLKAAKSFQAAAGDPKWDKKAEPWRQKVAAAVLAPTEKSAQAGQPSTPQVK